MSFDQLLSALTAYIESRSIAVRSRAMDIEKPAEFDGLSITINHRHDAESLAYYLAHSYGSIAGWCLDLRGVGGMFDELRDAKRTRDADPARLERALLPFRAFETRASEYAVRVLGEVGWTDARGYSIFFRADLEAITIFHRTGKAPIWRAFLDAWKRAIARGERPFELFQARDVPAFTPLKIELQEVKQEVDGRADDE